MTLVIAGILYYILGLAYCTWEFNDFHKRPDKRYPSHLCTQWHPLEHLLVFIGALTWPVLWVNDTLTDAPIGRHNRNRL